ncbi:MAG: UDP-N-acetylmuramoyl-L-alanyl-D-glutamate--2,6-diaminopimelate ligase [Hyphomicrobium sp.]|nr:UDP-N-acetylmuramoyl-L-alanyl-D-glutamate--2,6-diaminopimelate ligase [Hyphomicrobium sp.]
MRLEHLLAPSVYLPAAARALDIAAITADSRRVVPGSLFVAVPGTRVDGGQFVADAAARGAVAAIAEAEASVPSGVAIPVVRVSNVRQALSEAAARFFGRQPETIVAVTGTSGKTSVAEFTRQLFAASGRRAASLGTIGVVTPDYADYGSLTTPDPVTLHETLARLCDEQVTHLAMEASSHGLDQRRLDGVRLTAAAFTNLGRDHMDYHPTVAHYLQAKLRLLTELVPEGAPVVINSDGACGCEAAAAARRAGRRVYSTGRAGDIVELQDVVQIGFRQRLTLSGATWKGRVEFPLVGAYQVENALVAAGLVIATGEPADIVLPALAKLEGVKGRLEIVGEAAGGLGIVDYAHKPEALAAALDACRPFATGRLVCVFGCGGDRDRGKRPIMGAIAAEKADVVIVTDDNPRTEVPSAIRAEIMQGSPGAREIGDREAAIRTAVAQMGPGDVVLVAGKGHETGQIVGTTVLPFSDQDILKDALSRR